MCCIVLRCRSSGNVSGALNRPRIAFRHTRDVDPERRYDASKLQSLVYIAAERAKDILDTAVPGYSELHRFVMREVLNSMQVTHATICTVLTTCEGKPQSVDALVLARIQLEGLYNFCLMLEEPRYVDDYLRDGWKKRYVAFLLQREETQDLPRFAEFSNFNAPQSLEQLQEACSVTEAERSTIDHKELGVPMPKGLPKAEIRSFPTPGKAIGKVNTVTRRKMLERLYPEYGDLCSFAHGLPQSNLLKGFLNPHSLHRQLVPEKQALEVGSKEVTQRAFLVSMISIIQSAAEVLDRWPRDLDLLASVTDAWRTLSEDSLLGMAVWEIRTKHLLGII